MAPAAARSLPPATYYLLPTGMLTLLRTLSLGYLSQHRIRSVLVILVVALGVAVLVATQALSKSLGSGIQEGVNPLADLAHLLVVNGQSGVPASVADRLREARVPGVKDVHPYVLWRLSVLVGPEERGDTRVAWLIG